MIIVCENCGYEFKINKKYIHNIDVCPKCGAYLGRGEGVGLLWAK